MRNPFALVIFSLFLVALQAPAAQAVEGQDLIGVDFAHQLGLSGEGMVVAVLDEPMNPDHPYTKGKISAGFCLATEGDLFRGEYSCDGKRFAEGDQFIRGGTYADGSYFRGNHGHMVSGLIVGNEVDQAPRGIAYDASVAIYGTGSESDNVNVALEHIAENAERLGISAVSISLGNPGGDEGRVKCDETREAQMLKPSVEILEKKDIPIFAAAGNDYNHMGATQRPGCLDGVYQIGAVDNQGNIQDYSNGGIGIDLLAPSDIPTATYDGYQMGNGTSAATPVSAAAYLLLKQRYPELHHELIIDAMKLQGKVVDDLYFANHRLIDIPATIEYLDENAEALSDGEITIDQSEIAVVPIGDEFNEATQEESGSTTALPEPDPNASMPNNESETFVESDIVENTVSESKDAGALMVVVGFGSFAFGVLVAYVIFRARNSPTETADFQS